MIAFALPRARAMQSLGVMFVLSITPSLQAAPVLTPGVWTNLTPAQLHLSGTYGIAFVGIDPSDPDTLYVTSDMQGLWRTKDRGANWQRVGQPPASPDYGNAVSYLDSPIAVAVDPADSTHLYATQGVRGVTLGFWISHDSGATWTRPQGFLDTHTTIDVTSLEIDPSDFKHILLSSHNSWPNLPNAGVLESLDGGVTWIVHAPVASWSYGTMGVHFLFRPALGIGNSRTWLVANGDGFWRTTDAGANWTQVSTAQNNHGGGEIYYTQSGTLYAGAVPVPIRSDDNGTSWHQLSALPQWYYYTVQGDGHMLYTQMSAALQGGNGNSPQPYWTSAETDGSNWAPYNNGAQMFANGPVTMRFDSVNRIMYSANWDLGLWALKVLPASDEIFADSFE